MPCSRTLLIHFIFLFFEREKKLTFGGCDCSWVALIQYDRPDVLRSLEPLMHWNGPNDRLIRGSGQDWLIKKKRSTIRVTALSGIRTRAPFVCQSRKNLLREANCKRQKQREEDEVISLYFNINRCTGGGGGCRREADNFYLPACAHH